MNRSLWVLPWVGLLVFTQTSSPAQFKFPNRTFTVPDGFEMELVVAPPLADRPVEMDFDEQGRLYVTDSSGSSEKGEKQLQEKSHRIVRLEDTDGDGRFDKQTVFADKMMFPEGAMWFEGSLYVSAPPSIWKLTDTDGDGVADKREEWFQGKTLTGCANDLHGPYLGPDGWIYWCKGAFAKQTYERPGKAPFVTRAAHIFRARPDASGIEPVMTGGMDNPVGLAFTPEGERIFTTTFVDLSGAGKRDGILHAIYGGVYGKVNDVTDDHLRTGDLMPVMTQLGPAAPCGIIRYQSRVFGREFQNNLFVCQFNMHKVSRHTVEPDGATFKTQDNDFVTCDTTDFHPTDVVEDADGSLLMVDTGGWYKICCPTSQLYKPDVLGAIYRIRRKGIPKIADPRGLKIAWTELTPEGIAKLLDDERPCVRNRAIQEVAKRGSQSVPALSGVLQNSRSTSAEARRNAVWALCRLEGAQMGKLIVPGLLDPDPSVQHVALHCLSLRREASAASQLTTTLKSNDPQIARAAAEALGRIESETSAAEIEKRDQVAQLLARCSTNTDRVLEHSIIYALIEIGDRQSTARGVSGVSSGESRAALIALDQMGNSALKAGTVVPLLTSPDPILKQTAAWILKRHAEWGEDLGGFFRQALASGPSGKVGSEELENQLAHFANTPAIQDLLAQAALDSTLPEASRVIALRAMGQTGGKDTPQVWVAAFTQLLTQPNIRLLSQAAATARRLPAPKSPSADYSSALVRVGRDAQFPAEVRLDALAALPDGLAEVESADFDFLRAHLPPSNPVANRSMASTILARAKLSTEQQSNLADAFVTVGPLEVLKLLPAFDHAQNQMVGARLIQGLKQSHGLAALKPETLKPHLTNFPLMIQQQADELLASLNVDASKQREHLDELAAKCKGGDIRRGQMIFNSPKAACASCHSIGYLGGNVGPDLTRIGQIRTERDLLESIVYPSASFVRSFEPVVVTTKSGEEQSGVVKKDSADELVLATGPGVEVKLARNDVVEMRPGAVSVMPAGLDQLLSGQELADLLAFLKATQW